MSHIDPEQNVYEPENALLWVSVESCFYSIGIDTYRLFFSIYCLYVNGRVVYAT